MRESSTDIDNFVENWKNADISTFNNFPDNFFSKAPKIIVKVSNKNQQLQFCKRNASQMCKTIDSMQKISVLNQSEFASLEANKGSFFITVCCEKVQNFVWPTIYLSSKI